MLNKLKRLKNRKKGRICLAFLIVCFCIPLTAGAEIPVLKSRVDWDSVTKTFTVRANDEKTGYMKPSSEMKWESYYKREEMEQASIEGNFLNISDNLFQNCTSLKRVLMPDTVVSIGNDTFAGCSSLTEMEMSDNLERIGSGAFSGCNALEKVVLPGNVTEIGSRAFGGCTSLKSIVIPESVTTFEGQYDAIDEGSSVTVYGVKGSAAETFANRLGLKFDSSHVLEVTFDAGNEIAGTKQVLLDSTYGDLTKYTEFRDKKGYSFQGYFTSKEGGQKLTAKTRVTETGKKTVYGQWEANHYQVKFNSNGGTNVSEIKNVTYDSEYGELPVTTRLGYTFQGWYLKNADGTQTKITESRKVSTDSNHTLTAQWTANTYTIKIVKNGGSGVSQLKYSYNAVTKAPVLTHKSAKFGGWYTDKKFKNKFTFGKKMPAGNITVYAKWLKKSDLKKISKISYSVSGSNLVISSGKVQNADLYEYKISSDKSFKNAITVTTNKRSIKISSLEKEKKHVLNFSKQYIKIRPVMYAASSNRKKIYGSYSDVKLTGTLKFQPVFRYEKNGNKHNMTIINMGKADSIIFYFGTSKTKKGNDYSTKILAKNYNIKNNKSFQFLSQENKLSHNYKGIYIQLYASGKGETKYSKVTALK